MTGSGSGQAAVESPQQVDVVVVGGGNAGFCAAHAAAQRGRRVLLLEKASADEDGGNSYYTAGAFRVVHGGLEELAPLLEPDQRNATAVLAPYTAEDFHDDMRRLTGGRCDPELTGVLVDDSRTLLGWLHELGLRWRLIYERQTFQDAQGRHVFWGGLAVGTVGDGKGLIAAHTGIAERLGVRVRYGAQVTSLVTEDGRVVGVRYRDTLDPDRPEVEVRCGSVVLAAGGFEANPQLRVRYLGPEWERAVVRGNPYNTGEVLQAALEVGADRAGDWGSCHSVAWDVAGPPQGGDRTLTNQLTRQSYPIGIVVNRDGQRFVDEGADFRNYTYARYGREILRQPGGVAAQVFDSRMRPLLRKHEYEVPGVSVEVADTIPELAKQLEIDPEGLERTVGEFNAAVDRDTPFDPAVKDGRAARGISPPKSNWALELEHPPFYGYPVTCGITFTFGGVRIDPHARVLRPDGQPIPGLFACGELAGGLFAGNYPGGSGLTAGAVFGRRAGQGA